MAEFLGIPKYIIWDSEKSSESPILSSLILARLCGLNKKGISNSQWYGFYQETVLAIIGAAALFVKKKNKATTSMSTYIPRVPPRQQPAKILSKPISQDLYP